MTLKRAASIISAGLVLLTTGVVSGQPYPSKPIRIVTGGVGGSNDFVARLIAPGISGPLGQQVIVENRGSGFAAEETVLQALPDGYTLLLSSASLWLQPLLRKTPYDAVRDFSLITIVAKEPSLLVVTPSLPVKSVKELIALAKARPGELNHSTGSIGGPSHLALELFKSMTGVKIEVVVYKSDSQEIGDLISGYVQMTFQGRGAVGQHIKTGKLRALAVGTAQPTALAPRLPTIAETLPGFEHVASRVVFARANTPSAIITRLNQEIVRLIARPDVKQKFFDSGGDVIGNSPEEATATMKSDMARVSKVIKDAGIKVE